MTDIKKFKENSPMSGVLRMDRVPHIWCPGCGIGSEMNSFAEAIKRSGIDRKNLAVVSGIGCTGRVAGYVDLDSIHTTHGRAIAVATGLKLANEKLKVVVFSGEGDLSGIGGNHLIHAARRNMDMVVICNNNFTYGMTGGQVTPTTPGTAIASTTPYGNYEYPFSLPFLADAAGATYVARWTSMHARNVTQAIEEALSRKGFSFIEIISPCTTLYLRRNRLGDGVDMLQYFQDNTVLKHGADTRETAIDYQGKIVIGKFVDKDKPTYLECVDNRYLKVIGDDYQLYGKTVPERQAEEKAEKDRVAARRAAILAEEAKGSAKKTTPAATKRVAAKPAVTKVAAKKTPAKPVKKAVAKVVAKTAVKAVPKAPSRVPAKVAKAPAKKAVAAKAPVKPVTKTKVAAKKAAAPVKAVKKAAPKAVVKATPKKTSVKAPAKVSAKAAPKKIRK